MVNILLALVAAVSAVLTTVVLTFNADAFTLVVMLAPSSAGDCASARVADHSHCCDGNDNSPVVAPVSVVSMDVVLILVVGVMARSAN